MDFRVRILRRKTWGRAHPASPIATEFVLDWMNQIWFVMSRARPNTGPVRLEFAEVRPDSYRDMKADDMTTEVHRLFVAINLPAPIKEALRKLQEELARQFDQTPVAWANPDQCHLTLNFLGNVEVGKTPALAAALRMVGGAFTPLRLSVAGTGVFPDRRRPRVIWVGVRSDGDQLKTLQQATTGAVREICPLPDDKAFNGHITIGRCKSLSRDESRRLVARMESMSMIEIGSWTVSSFELMRSELSSNGAIHTVYEAISLTKK